jgi:hypothetical protein
MIAALGSSALVQAAGVTPIARMETIGLGRNAGLASASFDIRTARTVPSGRLAATPEQAMV